MVRTQDGSIGYTRNGSFGLANGIEGVTIADSDGNPLLDTTGSPIVIDEVYNPSGYQLMNMESFCIPMMTMLRYRLVLLWHWFSLITRVVLRRNPEAYLRRQMHRDYPD